MLSLVVDITPSQPSLPRSTTKSYSTLSKIGTEDKELDYKNHAAVAENSHFLSSTCTHHSGRDILSLDPSPAAPFRSCRPPKSNTFSPCFQPRDKLPPTHPSSHQKAPESQRNKDTGNPVTRYIVQPGKLAILRRVGPTIESVSTDAWLSITRPHHQLGLLLHLTSLWNPTLNLDAVTLGPCLCRPHLEVI